MRSDADRCTGKARPGRSGRWFLPLFCLIGFAGGACSPGENSLLNPGSNRDGLTSLPETLQVGTSAADRSYRSNPPAGTQSLLRVARTDSVEAIVFLRFTGVPDTANLTGARVGLRWAGGSGSGLRLASYRVTSGGVWTETGLTAADTTRLAPEPFDVFPDPLTPQNDTSLIRRAVQIPVEILREWRRDANLNLGIALRLTAGSPTGEARFLAREAVLDADSLVANPQIEYLAGDEVTQTASAAADAYVYVDRRPSLPGEETTAFLAEWLPTRMLLRFPVLDSLTALVGPIAPRLTINRAILRLHLAALAGPDDTLRVAAHRVLTDWDEATEPDSVLLQPTESFADLPAALDTLRDVVQLEVGPLVRAWVEGQENRGLVVRSVSETVHEHRLAFHTREAPDSLRPELEVVFTRPPDPRWGQVARGGAR